MVIQLHYSLESDIIYQYIKLLQFEKTIWFFVAIINQMVYTQCVIIGGNTLNSSILIKSLCDKMGVSESQLARDICQTPQNFNKKIQRDTLDFDEYKAIADVLGVTFEQAFTLPNGEKIGISSKDKA